MKNKIMFSLVIFLVSACIATPTQIINTITPNPTKVIISPAPKTPEIWVGIVVVQSLNLRSGPSRNNNIIGFINQDEEFFILANSTDEYNEQWLLIPMSDNTFGWVNGEAKFVTQVQRPVDADTYNKILNYVKEAKKIYTFIPLGGSSQHPSPTTVFQTPTLNNTSIMDCADTKDKVGQSVKCKIQLAYCTFQPSTKGDPTFCNDAPYPKHSFTLVVFGQDWSDYDGKCIVISGVVSVYDGKPQIETKNRARVSFCQ